MPYIKVDHKKFDDAAAEIDDYVQFLKAKMQAADENIRTLSASWQGKDFTQFQARWDALAAEASEYAKTIHALESYARFLRYADAQYKYTQDKAISRANHLPRY